MSGEFSPGGAGDDEEAGFRARVTAAALEGRPLSDADLRELERRYIGYTRPDADQSATREGAFTGHLRAIGIDFKDLVQSSAPTEGSEVEPGAAPQDEDGEPGQGEAKK